jgi:hypothetical protein
LHYQIGGNTFFQEQWPFFPLKPLIKLQSFQGDEKRSKKFKKNCHEGATIHFLLSFKRNEQFHFWLGIRTKYHKTSDCWRQKSYSFSFFATDMQRSIFFLWIKKLRKGIISKIALQLFYYFIFNNWFSEIEIYFAIFSRSMERKMICGSICGLLFCWIESFSWVVSDTFGRWSVGWLNL